MTLTPEKKEKDSQLFEKGKRPAVGRGDPEEERSREREGDIITRRQEGGELYRRQTEGPQQPHEDGEAWRMLILWSAFLVMMGQCRYTPASATKQAVDQP